MEISPLADSRGHKLRLAIVGGGDIGLRNGDSAARAPSVQIAAVYDSNPEIRQQMVKRFSVVPAESYEHLLERKDVDAVLLSVPHHLHASLGVAAAQAGKHVLVEKPMGVNFDAATILLNTCRAQNVRLTVNFSFRFKPIIQFARTLINEGVIGAVAGMQIVHLMFKSVGYWAGGFSGRSPSDWRGSKEKAGGGILIMGVSHTVDYLCYLTGLTISRVFAGYGTFASPVDVEDAIAVSLGFSNNAIGSITASTCYRGKTLREDRIWGNDGALSLYPDSVEFWSSKRWQDRAAGKSHVFKKFPNVDYTREWIERFAQAVITDKPHDITGDDGWINNAVIEAAYSSHNSGQAVTVASLLKSASQEQ